jgi:hypothetical protein
VNPRDALVQLATICGQITGIAQASYPETDVGATPILNLYWDETTITHGSEQWWLITVRGQLLAALADNASADKSAADALLAPIVDTFRPDPSNLANYQLVRPNGERVNHCQVTTLRPSMTIGGYYGAEIFWQIKLRRRPTAP